MRAQLPRAADRLSEWMDDTRFGDTDDRALAARVSAGDDAAFALLASRHRAALVRYAAHRLGGDRHAAEDAVQDALIKGLAAMRNGKVPEAPRAWLYCWPSKRRFPSW